MRHQVDAGQVPLSHICATECYGVILISASYKQRTSSKSNRTYKKAIEFPTEKIFGQTNDVHKLEQSSNLGKCGRNLRNVKACWQSRL